MATTRKKQKSKRRFFQIQKPHGMTESEFIGRRSTIKKIEAEIQQIESKKLSIERKIARREEQCRDADFRAKYHELRLSYLVENVV